MQSHNQKVYVWSLSMRIIHWVIACSFLLSFLTAFFHRYFILHIAFGYVFGLILCFRLLWGFIGPDYATFKTFILDSKSLIFYFKEKWHHRWRKIHCGHNAASSWFSLIVLAGGIGIVLSGIFLYGVQEGGGPLGSLNPHHYALSFIFEPLHSFISYFLLFWVCIHILGVLIEQFYHKTHMAFAMLLGYKHCIGNPTVVYKWQQLIAYSAIIGAMYLFYTVLFSSTLLTRTTFSKHDYAQENLAFYEKCGQCHKHYPAFMLPLASWEKMMDGLENHFGEKISENNISISEQKSIRAYLIQNSAETSTHKLAFKTLKSLGDMRPLSITKSSYWRHSHHQIKPSVFTQPSVKNKSNCFACHRYFENGIFENRFIHMP